MGGSAWSNQIQHQVIVGGVNGGMFLYTGTPRAGNPPIAWISQATSDPYGNALPANVIVSEDAATHILTALSGGLIQIGRGTIASNLWGQIAMNVTGVTGVDFRGFKNAILDNPAEFVLRSSSQNALGGTSGTVQLLGTTFLQASDPADGISPEPWHTLGTLPAGFTITRGRFKYSGLNQTLFDIRVTTAGANPGSGAFSVTLPAAYQPASGTYDFPLATGRAVTAGDQLPRLDIVGGTVTLVASAASVTQSLSGTSFMPLD